MRHNGLLGRAACCGMVAILALSTTWSRAEDKEKKDSPPARAPGEGHRIIISNDGRSGTAGKRVEVQIEDPVAEESKVKSVTKRPDGTVILFNDGKVIKLIANDADSGEGKSGGETKPAAEKPSGEDNKRPIGRLLNKLTMRPVEDDDDDDRPASAYWIGVTAEPVSELLRAQLSLEKGQGLSIGQIVPEGPAAKAGLQVNDIIIKFDGKPVGDVPQLIKAIDAAKGTPVNGTLLRGGKSVEFTVTPATRLEVKSLERNGDTLIPNREKAAAEAKKWLQQRLQEHGAPGNTYTGFTTVPIPEIPDDVTITITRDGKKPTKIVVKKGDQNWEIAEDQLDKLPESLRPLVKMLATPNPVPLTLSLDSGSVWIAHPGMPGQSLFLPEVQFKPWAVTIQPGAAGGTAAGTEAKPAPDDAGKLAPGRTTNRAAESRDEMILRRLERLQQTVEELKRDRDNERKERK